MTRWCRALLCMLVVLYPFQAMPLHAAPGSIPVFEDVGYLGGGLRHLPLGTGITREQVIAHAYTMPTVQTAIDEMLARGYVPYRDHDAACVSFDPPFAMAVLQFEKPGLIPPPDHIGAPAIMVGTALDATGQPQTAVSGGLMFVNMNDATMWTADSLAEYQMTDASFDVAEGGGEPGEPLMRPSPGTLILGTTNSPGDRKFRKWVYCFAVGSLTRVLSIVTTTPPVPQLTVGRIIAEHIFIAVTCAIGVLADGNEPTQ